MGNQIGSSDALYRYSMRQLIILVTVNSVLQLDTCRTEFPSCDVNNTLLFLYNIYRCLIKDITDSVTISYLLTRS